MLKGGGIAGVAVVLILLLATVSGYWLGRADSGRWARPNGSNYDACKYGDYNRCKTQPVVLDPVDREYRPANPYEQAYRNEYRDERDLAAQREMATWARAAFFTSLIGVGLLFVTWHATAQGVHEARHVGEKQVQAYLMCNEGQMRIRPFIGPEHTTKWGITCNLLITNKGQSPAKNVDIRSEVWLFKESPKIPGNGSGYFHELCEKFCADVAPGDSATAIIELALFSGGEFDEFERAHNWLDIRGEMIWTNEFGNQQRQAINLASPKFWAANFFPDAKFDPSIRVQLVGIGRRTTKIM